MLMKSKVAFFLLASSLLLSGCGLSELIEGDNDSIHKNSYDPITGKFVL